MLWIATHQFAAHLRIQRFPEARKISRGLHRSVIRSKKMDYHRNLRYPDAWSVTHAEEVLQARSDPRRLTAFVMDSDLTSAVQPNVGGSDFAQALPFEASLEHWNNALGGSFQFGKATQPRTQGTKRLSHVRASESGKLYPGHEMGQVVRIDK